MTGFKRKLAKWQRFFSSTLFGPKLVRLNPVPYLCNHDCPMCWRLSLDKETRTALTKKAPTALKLSDYEQLLSELPKKVQEIELVGGGEPLLFSKIAELMALIRKKGKSGSLITNGALLTSRIADALVSVQWQKVRVSVHATSQTAYNRVNGRDDLSKVKKNIIDLLEKRGKSLFPKVTLLFVVQKDNIAEIEQFMEMAITLGVDRVEYDWLLRTTPKALKLTSQQRAAVVKRLLKLSKTQKIEHNIPNLLELLHTHPNWGARGTFGEYSGDKYCQITLDSLELDGYGRVVPCCIAYDSNDILYWSPGAFWKIWQSMQPLRSRLTQGKFEKFCNNCTYSLDLR